LSDPPALVVGHAMVGSPTAADRFQLGRMLYLLRDGSLAVELLSVGELQRLFSSAIFAVEPSALQGATVPQLDEHARALRRNLSRRARNELPLAVNRLLQEGGRLDVPGWATAVLNSANRAAFLVCADIVVAVQQLAGALGDPADRSSEENVKLLVEHALATDLLPFSVSTQYFELRQLLQK